MKRDNAPQFKSFITFGFGSSDTEVNLYWSNNTLKTINKFIDEQNSNDHSVESVQQKDEA